MCAAREGASLWFYLFHRYPSGRWAGWDMTFRKPFQSPYFWHDTFGQYIYRWFLCEWFGHNKVRSIPVGNGYRENHCFACEQRIRGK